MAVPASIEVLASWREIPASGVKFQRWGKFIGLSEVPSSGGGREVLVFVGVTAYLGRRGEGEFQCLWGRRVEASLGKGANSSVWEEFQHPLFSFREFYSFRMAWELFWIMWKYEFLVIVFITNSGSFDDIKYFSRMTVSVWVFPASITVFNNGVS